MSLCEKKNINKFFFFRKFNFIKFFNNNLFMFNIEQPKQPNKTKLKNLYKIKDLKNLLIFVTATLLYLNFFSVYRKQLS